MTRDEFNSLPEEDKEKLVLAKIKEVQDAMIFLRDVMDDYNGKKHLHQFNARCWDVLEDALILERHFAHTLANGCLTHGLKPEDLK